MSDSPYILYGMSASLYTGKARAYLIHHGVPFIERGAGHPQFTQEIVPQIGRWIIPVLVTPGGHIIQDGADIIDYLDAQGFSRNPVIPAGPLLRAVSHLFELFGGEGLLRPAMHYRWNFDSDNLDFLRVNFSEAFPPGLDAAQQSAMFDHSSGRMRKAGNAFGVSADTAPAIEASYAVCLSLLEAHFSQSYYLLGGHPTLGDYGLMNGLYAHLSRDPHPSMIMKRRAPRVFAWTERMNRHGRDDHNIAGAPDGLFTALPGTLIALMQFIAADFLPEMTAHTAFINDWLAAQDSIPAGPMERILGFAAFDWHGQPIKTAVMPYRSWLIQRLQDHYDGCIPEDRARIDALFNDTGLSALLTERLTRRVERAGNREVWGASSA